MALTEGGGSRSETEGVCLQIAPQTHQFSYPKKENSSPPNKTALFLSVTWTNPSLSAMTPFGRHSRSHPSQLRSQPARNERTKPLFASGNNPLRRSTSFLSFFRRFSLCFAQPEAVHQIYQCLALQVCTNAAGATSLTVRGYTQTNSIKTIIWDLQYFSNPDHRAPVHGSVPRR